MSKSFTKRLTDAELKLLAGLVEIRFHVAAAQKQLDLAMDEADAQKNLAYQMAALKHVEKLRELCGIEDDT